MSDKFNLQRFVAAQNPVIQNVLSELQTGSKQTHWMWFIFPQIAGLSGSIIAQRFAISSLGEADAYLRHSVLGPRLYDCTQRVNLVDGQTANQIFGYPDDLKFRSSMTLFREATAENVVFEEALQKYFGGKPDVLTLERL
ncbi:MAG TPA: DUF1810 domain-containing protein [Candidatus Scalindua sp.]|nr:DUF1810 domain-containing protein [Candidatus Scalindua sp.]